MKLYSIKIYFTLAFKFEKYIELLLALISSNIKPNGAIKVGSIYKVSEKSKINLESETVEYLVHIFANVLNVEISLYKYLGSL
ncbi:hypothetical protein [Clostridium sardiniense]